MKIQFNTDNHISGNERLATYFTDIISTELDRFAEHITRVEVHLSDENSHKSGPHDKRCVLEARVENRKPVAVTGNGATIEQAVSESVDKLKAALGTIFDRMTSH